MFKVVPDQLRISDGWVRCGQCDEVFDANAHLYSEPMGERGGDTVDALSSSTGVSDSDWKNSLRFDTPSLAEDAAASEAPAQTEEVVALDAVSVEVERTDNAVVEAVSPVIDPVLDVEGGAFEPSLDALLDLRPGHAMDGFERDAVLVPERPVSAPEPRYAQAQVKTVEAPEVSTLSFMRQARASHSWQRVVARLLLSLMVVVLSGILGLQLVVHERDRIAATEPRAKALLSSLCGWMGCTIQPVRQIDAVVIDSSSFTKVRGDVYRLNVTLKSLAPIPLAVPALELTLTDMDDQPMVRRVLLAPQIGAGKDTMDAGAELSAVLPLRVSPGAQTARISGYRLLAFYP